MALVDVIIPSFDNPNYLVPCVRSFGRALQMNLVRIIIVNNGQKESVPVLGPGIEVIQAGKNLGWEGGLKLGLEHSDSEFVLFCNDDIVIPQSSFLWLENMLQHFRDPACSAVGPSSNCVMGLQSMFWDTGAPVFKTTYLIGFFMLVRRKALELAGGIDDELPGGDDLDLSIRLRKVGGYLVCDKTVFIYHHGFKTGERVNGADWNSVRMQEATNKALWEKHGLKEYLDTLHNIHREDQYTVPARGDTEGDLVRKYTQGGRVYELGCGDTKTLKGNVGVDVVPRGAQMGGVYNRFSDADIVANVFDPLPIENADCFIARHILEHTHDPINAVRNWKKSLKHGGRLIVAVPDESLMRTIPLNPEHKCAFTKISLQRLMETEGYKTISIEDSGNDISLVGVFEANGAHV